MAADEAASRPCRCSNSTRRPLPVHSVQSPDRLPGLSSCPTPPDKHARFSACSLGELRAALCAMEADGEDAPVLLVRAPSGDVVHFTF